MPKLARQANARRTQTAECVPCGGCFVHNNDINIERKDSAAQPAAGLRFLCLGYPVRAFDEEEEGRDLDRAAVVLQEEISEWPVSMSVLAPTPNTPF